MLAFHPYADIFPLIQGEELAGLVADIKANGLREKIVTLDGTILDGRNRYLGCIGAGLITEDELPQDRPLLFQRFVPAVDGDALKFVISKNLKRRHLDTSQRGLIAGRLASLKLGDNQHSEGLPIGRASELMVVGERTAIRGKEVATEGVPELQAAVERREMTLGAAADLAKLPKQEQRDLLHRIAASPDGRSVLKQVAKEVRAQDQKAKHTERQERLEELAAHNPDYPAGRLFSFVLIDVPRHHNVYADETGSEKAPENHYLTMSFDELLRFPIDQFAAPCAIIAYWSTAASLIDDIDILGEWGFVSMRPRDGLGKLVRPNGEPLPAVAGGKYGSHQIWRKVRVGNQMGMGRWFRDQHELLIMARRGDVPAPLPGTQDDSVFDAPVGEHSAKPHDHVREWIDRCWPELFKIEIFARGVAPGGWTFWGNQAEPKADSTSVTDGSVPKDSPLSHDPESKPEAA